MAELEFERRLERLLADAPMFADSEAFAQRVESRLDRGWNMRRWMIGAAGVVGGVVGASQLVLANVVHRVEDASLGSVRLVEVGLAKVKPGFDILSLLQFEGLWIWVGAGMAVIAMGFVLTRFIEEF
jgi:hypothetical protein